MRNTLLNLALATVLGLALVAPADAQSGRGKAGPDPSQPTPTPAASEPDLGPIISIEFPGGNAKQFCDAVAEAAGDQPINILLPDDAKAIVIPAFTLRRVSVKTALSTMAYLAAGEIAVEPLFTRSNESLTFAVRRASLANPTLLKAGGKPATTPAPAADALLRGTRVYSLRSLVEPPEGLATYPEASIPLEVLMSAISAAVKLDGDESGPPPDLMLHRESLMLVCRGDSQQQNVVVNVLHEMNANLQPRRGELLQRIEREREAKLQALTLSAEINQARAMLDRSKIEVDLAGKRLSQTSELAKSGGASSMEVDQLRAALAKAQSIVNEAASHLEMLTARKALIEAQPLLASSPFGQRSAPPAAEAGADADRTLVIYNGTDLAPFEQDVLPLVEQLAGRGGKVQVLNHSYIVTATPEQHARIKGFLTLLVRTRANDPKAELPGDAPGLAPEPR